MEIRTAVNRMPIESILAMVSEKKPFSGIYSLSDSNKDSPDKAMMQNIIFRVCKTIKSINTKIKSESTEKNFNDTFYFVRTLIPAKEKIQ